MITNRARTARGGMNARAQNPRGGFTLIEILMAITILAGVVLTMAMSTTVSARKVGASGTRSRAQAIVDQQISRARTWPTYASLSQLSAAKYNPTTNGLLTATTVNSDTTAGRSITTIKVTVTGATTSVLATPIVRSISIAAP
ncbi:MAG: prepilin-type N-terminal cleavage/methylation domain-containing protein [Phycisphaerae bacterium]|nr:prepilin-type N-terminal cleavage/methylation domain-containing protein [Gemmatimonadaceae bacterium]